MGNCWSPGPDLIGIPMPAEESDEPPPGYEYIPLDKYIMAIEINQNQRSVYGQKGVSFNDPWNDSVFT